MKKSVNCLDLKNKAKSKNIMTRSYNNSLNNSGNISDILESYDSASLADSSALAQNMLHEKSPSFEEFTKTFKIETMPKSHKISSKRKEDHIKNNRKKRMQSKCNPPKITIKIGHQLMCTTSGNTEKSLKNNFLSTYESEKLEGYESKSPEAIHMFGSNDITQFDTIADKVKTRKRGSGGMSSQNIFKSFSDAENSNVIPKRRKKTPASVKNPISENSCEIPNLTCDMPENCVDPVDTSLSTCGMMDNNLNSKRVDSPVCDLLFPPIQIPENALVGNNLQNMINDIYHITFKTPENVKATSDDLFDTLLKSDWKIVEDAIEGVVDSNLAVSLVKPCNHVISEKPKCSSTNELPEEVLSLILEATPKSEGIADEVFDLEERKGVADEVPNLDSEGIVDEVPNLESEGIDYNLVIERTTLDRERRVLERKGIYDDNLESDVSENLILKDEPAPNIPQPSVIEYAEMFIDNTKISVGAYVDAIEPSTSNLEDLSVLPQGVSTSPAIKQELAELPNLSDNYIKKGLMEYEQEMDALHRRLPNSNCLSILSCDNTCDSKTCLRVLTNKLSVESSTRIKSILRSLIEASEKKLIKDEGVGKKLSGMPKTDEVSDIGEPPLKRSLTDPSLMMPLVETIAIKQELIETEGSNEMIQMMVSDMAEPLPKRCLTDSSLTMPLVETLTIKQELIETGSDEMINMMVSDVTEPPPKRCLTNSSLTMPLVETVTIKQELIETEGSNEMVNMMVSDMAEPLPKRCLTDSSLTMPLVETLTIKQELIETGSDEIINKKELAELPKSENAVVSSFTKSIAPSASLKYLPQNLFFKPEKFSEISSLSNNEISSCVPTKESSKTAMIMPSVETQSIKEPIQKSDLSQESAESPKLEQAIFSMCPADSVIPNVTLKYLFPMTMKFGEFSEIPSVPSNQKLSSASDTAKTSSKILAVESSLKMPLENQIMKPELIKTKYSNDVATKKGSAKFLNIKDVGLSKCLTKAMVSTNVIQLSEKTSSLKGSLQLNKTLLPCNAKIVKPSSLKIIYLKKAPATKPGTDNLVTKKKSANIQNIIKETTKRKTEDLQVENTVPSGYCPDPGVSSTNRKQLNNNAMNIDESSRTPCALLNNKKSSPDVIKVSSKNALQTYPSATIPQMDMQIRKQNLPKIPNTNEAVVKTKTLGKTLCYITANSAISLSTKLPIVRRMSSDKNCTIPLGKLSASISESNCVQHNSCSSSSQSQHGNDTQPSTPYFHSLPFSEKKSYNSTKKTSLVNSSNILSVKHDSVTNTLLGEIVCQSDPKDLQRVSKIDNLFTKSNQLNTSQFAPRSQSSRSPTDLGHNKSKGVTSQSCNKSRKHHSRSPISRDLHHSKYDAKLQMCADDKKCESLEKKKIEAMHERRIVYVGNLPSDYTETQLKDRFKVFGAIESIEIKSKDCDSLDANDINSEGYLGNAQSKKTVNSLDARRHPLRENKKKFFGFITFKTQADATKAIERGNNCKGPILHINYGGRRHFVKEDYTDLDGRVAQTEEFLYNSQTQCKKLQEKEDDYALMLKQELKKRGLVSSASNSRHSHH